MGDLTLPASRLLQHLSGQFSNGGYPDPASWGYAFTLLAALEQNSSLVSNRLANAALDELVKQDKTTNNFSWEFVVYAWNRSCNICGELDRSLVPYGEKGTRMVNWTLLRQLNRFHAKKKTFRARCIVWGVRKLFTLPDGQILDEFKTRSLQYHAFCLFVVLELYQVSNEQALKEWLVRGLIFSLDNALTDGVALYIGRGQEQIFGYGALLMVGEYALKKWPECLHVEHVTALSRITGYLLSFQRDNGSFPLVLNSDQPECEQVTFKHHNPHGWYGYNTLYDYQPFLAYCLLRAQKFKNGLFL